MNVNILGILTTDRTVNSFVDNQDFLFYSSASSDIVESTFRNIRFWYQVFYIIFYETESYLKMLYVSFLSRWMWFPAGGRWSWWWRWLAKSFSHHCVCKRLEWAFWADVLLQESPDTTVTHYWKETRQAGQASLRLAGWHANLSRQKKKWKL